MPKAHAAECAAEPPFVRQEPQRQRQRLDAILAHLCRVQGRGISGADDAEISAAIRGIQREQDRLLPRVPDDDA